MACRMIQFEPIKKRPQEWTPMALREAVCVLRKNPGRHRSMKRSDGIDPDCGERGCKHNFDASWKQCPFYQPRSKPTQ